MRTSRAILAWALALLALAPAAAPAGAGASAFPAPLFEGDSASYVVRVGTPVQEFSFTLDVLPGVERCEDGFGRAFRCATLWMTYGPLPDPQPRFSVPVRLSLRHGEVIGWGSWELAGVPEMQAFAAPAYVWEGHPQSDPASDLADAFRVLFVGALGLATRARDAGPGDVVLAGARGVLDVELTRPGHADVAGSFATTTLTHTYAATFPAGESLPSVIRVDAGGTSVGEATRVAYARGAGAVAFASPTRALDFPEVRVGATREAWGAFPPGGDGFYHPLATAWKEARLLPNAALHHLAHPDAYLVLASYDETRTPRAAGLDTALARWHLMRGGEAREVQETGLTRFGLAIEPRVFVDTADEEATGPAPGFFPSIPPRATLPATLVRIDDAKRIGEAYIPTDAGNFSFQWRVEGKPDAFGTDAAAFYTLSCGTVGAGHPSIRVVLSAATGQVWMRSGDGSSVCAPSS